MTGQPTSDHGDDTGDLARELIKWGVTGRRRDLIRLIVGRLGSQPGVSTAAGAMVDESGSRLSMVRLEADGFKDGVVAVDDAGPLIEAFRAGKSIVGTIEPGRRTTPGAIVSAVPLVVNGSVVGCLGIGGHDLSREGITRLEDLAALAGLAMENATLQRSAARSITEIATVLSTLIESRDTYTESHCVALAEMSVGVAIRMGLDDRQLTVLNLAGHMHDIGKVSIPDEVLLKRGPLTDSEFAVMRSHASIGEDVLSKIAYFVEVAPVVGQHHERFDGTGYPRGLRGDQILLEARILSVVDAFDAMTSSRPYRRALSNAVAVQEIEDGAGSQFDPEVAGIFLHYLEGEQAQWKRDTSR